MKEYQSPYSEYGMESGLDFNFPLLKITQGLRPTIPPNCPIPLKQMIGMTFVFVVAVRCRCRCCFCCFFSAAAAVVVVVVVVVLLFCCC
jgi:hypothetical protein